MKLSQKKHSSNGFLHKIFLTLSLVASFHSSRIFAPLTTPAPLAIIHPVDQNSSSEENSSLVSKDIKSFIGSAESSKQKKQRNTSADSRNSGTSSQQATQQQKGKSQQEDQKKFNTITANVTHLTLANGVRFSVAGSALFNFFGVSQSNKFGNIYEGNANEIYQIKHNMWPTHDQDFMFAVNNGKLDFNITGGSLEEFQYAFHTILGIGNKILKQCFLMIENKESGALIIGNTSGGEIRLLNSPVDELVATGGVNGAFSTVVNMTTWCDMSSSMSGSTGNATKLTYISPRIKGFKIGVSFTPDSDHFWDSPMETSFSNNKKNDPGKTFSLNVFTVTANYAYVTDSFSLDLSGSVLTGDCRPERPDIESLKRFPNNSVDLGLVLGFKPDFARGKFFFGLEYIYNGRSGLFSQDDLGSGYQDAEDPLLKEKGIIPVINEQPLEAKKYTADLAGNSWIGIVGLGYNDRKSFGVSFSYLHSQKNTGFTNYYDETNVSEKAIGNAYVISYEYYIRPGLSWYVELGFYNMNNPDADYIGHKIASSDNWRFTSVDSNDATAVVTGIKFNF